MSDGKSKVIGTHNGKFHADEVLGCFLLKSLPEYKSAVIKRTRDPEELKKCDIVIDVGGEYDHEKKRYDHHQRGFMETLRFLTGIEEDIKLSSAGLVWAHYGKDVLKSMVEKDLSEKELHDVYCRMYENFVREVDARDNGIEIAEPPLRYKICTDFSSRVARLNVRVAVDDDSAQDKQFMKAVLLAEEDFRSILHEVITYWLPSKEVVNKALDARLTVDPSGRIIKIEKPGVTWPHHLLQLETEKKIKKRILFVLFPDLNNGWRVQAVSRDGGFLLRQQILPTCLAMRDEELIDACGVKDAIFVHASGFIGGAKSYEGVLKMAQQSIVDDDTDFSDS